MKKLRLFGLVALVAILATGCGEKKLVCTMSEDGSDFGLAMEEKVTMKFKDDKMSNVTMNMTAKIENEELQAYWSTFADELSSEYPEVSKDGLKVSTKTDASKYTFSVDIDVDVNKVSEADLEEYNLEDILEETGTMDEIKAQFEENGFTCK